MPDTTSPVPKLEKALAFAAEQVRGTVERYPDFYPMYTRAGQWKHGGTGSASRAGRPSRTSWSRREGPWGCGSGSRGRTCAPSSAPSPRSLTS